MSSAEFRAKELGVSALQQSFFASEEQVIIDRGKKDLELLGDNWTPLQVPVIKGAGAVGGFGAIKKSKKQVVDEAKALAKTLRREGVVRIDKVLSEEAADGLRAYCLNLRAESETDVREGGVGASYRFADVLLRTKRVDLKLPLFDSSVTNALHEIVNEQSGLLGHVIQHLLGKHSPLYELSALISEPGSQRQKVHPDTPFGGQTGSAGDDAPLYSVFIALQDVRLDMGPTTWLPRTHTASVHAEFTRDEASKDALLQLSPAVLGVLPKGCAAIFDSRTLHCGGANESPSSAGGDNDRALFYITFKNPKVVYAGNPGSLRPELIGAFNLGSLREELALEHSSAGSSEKILELNERMR